MRDLEQRVREYELHGVQASISLQTAARAVLRENARLRSLLRQRGIMDAEVTSYLDDDTHASDHRVWDRRPAQFNLSSSTQSNYSQDRLMMPFSSRANQKPKANVSSQSSAGRVLPLKSAILDTQLDEAEEFSTLFDSGQSIGSQLLQAPVPWSASQKVSTSLCRNKDGLQRSKEPQTNMRSCIEAAMIIASMNYGLSTEDAKAELGCSPSDDCFVANQTLFQAMDR